MTDKERYKAAFSHLHASGAAREENKGMKHRFVRGGAVVAAVAALTLTAAGAANAATDGALLEGIRVVFSGELTNAQHNSDGSTTYTATGDDGSRIAVTVPEGVETETGAQVHARVVNEDESASELDVTIGEDGAVVVGEQGAAAEKGEAAVSVSEVRGAE